MTARAIETMSSGNDGDLDNGAAAGSLPGAPVTDEAPSVGYQHRVPQADTR